MARTALTAQTVTSAGLEIALTAAIADGHSIPMGSGYVLLVRNLDASDKTITIPTPLTEDGLAIADRTIVVTAGEDRYIAVGNKRAYRQADGSAYVDYSALTAVTVALLRVP